VIPKELPEAIKCMPNGFSKENATLYAARRRAPREGARQDQAVGPAPGAVP